MAKQNKVTKTGLPVFSTNTESEAHQLFSMHGRYTFFSKGSNEGKSWGYVFNNFNPFDGKGNTDPDKMDSEMERVRQDLLKTWKRSKGRDNM